MALPSVDVPKCHVLAECVNGERGTAGRDAGVALWCVCSVILEGGVELRSLELILRDQTCSSKEPVQIPFIDCDPIEQLVEMRLKLLLVRNTFIRGSNRSDQDARSHVTLVLGEHRTLNC